MTNTEIIGHYCIIQKKADPDIILTDPAIRSIENIREFLKKIDFYFPEMKKLFDGMPIEDYPRRTLHHFNSPCSMCDYAGICIENNFDDYSLEYDATGRQDKPYISPSDIIQYETCPRQWGYYKSGIRTIRKKATVECGTCIHTAIHKYLIEGSDPVCVFNEEWEKWKGVDTLQYNSRDSHQLLSNIASSALKKFPQKWEEFGFTVKTVETSYSIDMGNYILKVRPDVVAEKNGNITVIDWKFTQNTYSPQWIKVSDQITAAAAVLLLLAGGEHDLQSLC